MEKKQFIKDINGKPFYNENIDCFKIMQDYKKNTMEDTNKAEEHPSKEDPNWDLI